METIATSINFSLSIDGKKPRATLTLQGTLEQAQQWQEELQGLEKMSVSVKKYRAKRSLNANAYLWVLLQKLAEALRTTKDEVYLMMLDRYGQFTFIEIIPEALARVKQEWRTSRVVGMVEERVQLQVFFGSSTYNTKEFSVLLEGVVDECKILGIETLPDDEVKALLERWEK